MASAWTDYIEITLAFLLHYRRGYDAWLLTRKPIFTSLPPDARITITSPDNGPSGSFLDPDFTQVGADRLPTLTWTLPAALAGRVAQYALVVEDADAPLMAPICHGIIWGMPGSTTRITAADIALVDPASGLARGIRAGWNTGLNFRRRVHYLGARALMGHGQHRYFYQLIALGHELEPADADAALTVAQRKQKFGNDVAAAVANGLSRSDATREELEEAIKGKVVGYGEWVGRFERRFGVKYGKSE